MIQPPTTGIAQATGLANAGQPSRRLRDAENIAELKAMRGSRFPFLRRVLNRLSRRSG